MFRILPPTHRHRGYIPRPFHVVRAVLFRHKYSPVWTADLLPFFHPCGRQWLPARVRLLYCGQPLSDDARETDNQTPVPPVLGYTDAPASTGCNPPVYGQPGFRLREPRSKIHEWYLPNRRTAVRRYPRRIWYVRLHRLRLPSLRDAEGKPCLPFPWQRPTTGRSLPLRPYWRPLSKWQHPLNVLQHRYEEIPCRILPFLPEYRRSATWYGRTTIRGSPRYG